MRAVTFLTVILSLAACQVPADSSSNDNSEPADVSMYQLVSTPERFDGKRVRVIGYLHLEFEGNGLYAQQEDFAYHLYKNGVWISISDCRYANNPPINDAYVLIEARFNGKDKGHMDLWSGSLSDVTRCVIWRNPRRTSNLSPTSPAETSD